jgi:cation transport ATPase
MNKKVTNLILLLITVFGLKAFAADVTKNFKVLGRCDMCRERIENVALALEGVEYVRWDRSKQNLTVSYNEQKTSLQKIQTAVTMKGHDTELFSASDVRFNELPGCCKYERGETKKKNVHNTGNLLLQNMMPGSTECIHDKSPTEGSCCEK